MRKFVFYGAEGHYAVLASTLEEALHRDGGKGTFKGEVTAVCDRVLEPQDMTLAAARSPVREALDRMTEEAVEAGVYDRWVPLEREPAKFDAALRVFERYGRCCK